MPAPPPAPVWGLKEQPLHRDRDRDREGGAAFTVKRQKSEVNRKLHEWMKGFQKSSDRYNEM